MTVRQLQRATQQAADLRPIRWPRFPVIFEMNAWVWIAELSKKYGKRIDLGSVPAVEWDEVSKDGIDAIWLMGVWERSPSGIAIANKNGSLTEEFRRALPDFRAEDNVGSPYCVRGYLVDRYLGGPEALTVARWELAKRGLKLLLDFVPNHVAPDHKWVHEHPEYFVHGTTSDLQENPASYLEVNGNILACGKDPFFPAWPDVVQLNSFEPGLRIAVIQEISSVARQCDGIRCDMAMLLLNDVFSRTWKGRVQEIPATEFWDDVIQPIKSSHPDFIFVAEAYWDLEWTLQQHGFDYCYDKRLYDRLLTGTPEEVRLHLLAENAYQEKLIRFIENHDEPRAAAVFSPEKERVAAIAISTVPGARLFHQGQFEGQTIKLPVFLGRAPQEEKSDILRMFYSKLLYTLDEPLFHEGNWQLCEVSGWPDNQSCRNLVSWLWNEDQESALIVLNLSDACSDGRVRVPLAFLAGKQWRLLDAFSSTAYDRSGDQMLSEGMYVKLGPWEFHFFRCFSEAAINEPQTGKLSSVA